MRAFKGAERVAKSVLMFAFISSIGATCVLAEGQHKSRSWAAVGIGLAPAPYGLDGNGSPVGDVTLGKRIRERMSIVATVAHFEFFGTTPARFASVSAGVRGHLSKKSATDGGPYLGIAPVFCRASYRDRGVSQVRVLPGVEVAVGTEIPVTLTVAFDWSASHVLTPEAGGFSPNPQTHSTKRDGLDRGTVRIRLVLRR